MARSASLLRAACLSNSTPRAALTLPGLSPRFPAMSEPAAEFTAIVCAILARFFRQNAQPPPADARGREFAARLRALIAERGLPRPLAVDETGRPGGMSEAECAPLLARVLPAGAEPLFVEAARQLVKACFYPEFKICRDSYREVAADGACRRQQLERARLRTSGAHCVDCPHWVALAPVEHVALLEDAWFVPGGFAPHRGIFLPEDFRALRTWLWRAARAEQAASS